MAQKPAKFVQLFFDVDSLITVPAPKSTSAEVWVDTDITGNTATSLGPEQVCKRVELTSGNTFQVDVVGYNLPAFGAFHIPVYFDSRYVEFVDFNEYFLLTSKGGKPDIHDTAGPFTDPSNFQSEVIVGAHLMFPGPEACGTGVIARLTFSVKAPYGQTGIDIDPSPPILNRIFGVPVFTDDSHAKSVAVIDPTKTVGCWTVNSTDDTADSAPGDGRADADPTLGIVKTTLRAAMQEANAISGPNRISFRIPGSGPTWTIAPTSPLPALTDPQTTIDGSTQSGVIV